MDKITQIFTIIEQTDKLIWSPDKIQTHFDKDMYSLSYGHKTKYDMDNITQISLLQQTVKSICPDMIQTHFDTDVYSLSYGHKTQYDADNIT